MKKIFAALALTATVISCSEDFEVAAPYKDITVVYGLLNITDTAHYIRVEKAFLDEHKSAVVMAQIPDSSFYATLDVTIKEFSGATQVDNISLQKVDLNAEGYPKDPGSFFPGPSWAYKFKKQLDPNHTYRLVITTPTKTDSSEINVLDNNFVFTVPKFRFEKLSPPAASKYTLFVNTTPKNSYYAEAMVRFRWTSTLNNVSTDDSADFIFGSKSDLTGNGSGFSLVVENSSFYSFLRDALGVAQPGEERYLDSVDFILLAAGSDFADYIRINNVLSSGLTAEQIKPLYSNIKGQDVIGLFSSRSIKIQANVPIDSIMLDSLRVNAITAPCNIRGFSDH